MSDQYINTSCFETDLDWLIYADYLDDQGINHFIREDTDTGMLWYYEYRFTPFDGVGLSYNGGIAGISRNGGYINFGTELVGTPTEHIDSAEVGGTKHGASNVGGKF
jgi:hypothetical protein